MKCKRLSCDCVASFRLHVFRRAPNWSAEDLCPDHCRAAQDALAKRGVDHWREPLVYRPSHPCPWAPRGATR